MPSQVCGVDRAPGQKGGSRSEVADGQRDGDGLVFTALTARGGGPRTGGRMEPTRVRAQHMSCLRMRHRGRRADDLADLLF